MNTLYFNDYKIVDKTLLSQSKITVLKTSFQDPMEAQRWNALLKILPSNLQNEVRKYRRWEDQHNTLLGKFLVYFAFYVLKGEKLNFKDYLRDQNNKPFVKNSNLNFNISHSDKTVVCAISEEDIQLGIDIEEIKHIDIQGFKNLFHSNEFDQIVKTNEIEDFYKYWTRKEAFTKAIGKGITMPLSQIDTSKHEILEDKNRYYIESHQINNFFCSLVYNKIRSEINWIEINF